MVNAVFSTRHSDDIKINHERTAQALAPRGHEIKKERND